ncbi:hypothetical protein BHE74_00001282 [Ensete ventricosum]|uniref:Uncharacterized protein n=1 Tax=Ensete ventricosum TaxID=4639 RepID=A0A427A2E5_ENSVE|nr:hypothetical protein B296_00019339 [Ensete ventricosum]RWW28685.1 hypothetical protein GW17_00006828 [Ensete ventricosum]RWW89682.1 hypothetical protein BHE74_00001282 [Ensete ventricosum]RZR88254.1 hypothetical protein BHM03_00015806 [Ensete ventricosum]
MIDLVLSVSDYHSHDLVDFVVLGQISLQQSGIRFRDLVWPFAVLDTAVYPLGIIEGLYFFFVEYATMMQMFRPLAKCLIPRKVETNMDFRNFLL